MAVVAAGGADNDLFALASALLDSLQGAEAKIQVAAQDVPDRSPR